VPRPGHAKVQRLVATRFWRQQVAFDLWLQTAGPTDLLAAALVGRVARIAPVTITEL
jgi:hypothetical protein